MKVDMYKELLARQEKSAAKPRTRAHEESELQRQCVTWFRLQYPTEVFTSEWEGVVLIRDGKVYGYND